MNVLDDAHGRAEAHGHGDRAQPPDLVGVGQPELTESEGAVKGEDWRPGGRQLQQIEAPPQVLVAPGHHLRPLEDNGAPLADVGQRPYVSLELAQHGVAGREIHNESQHLRSRRSGMVRGQLLARGDTEPPI